MDRQCTLAQLSTMNLLHIVGRKNHGKTTLMVEFVRELTRQGLHVGTIKHTSHVHELDVPGKDSFRHRLAGGDPAAIITQDLIGLYLPRVFASNTVVEGNSGAGVDFYERLEPMFTGCDLVLVEGHLAGPGTKIEVWREAVGGRLLASDHKDIAAVISDDQPDVDVPVWPRSDISRLAQRLGSVRRQLLFPFVLPHQEMLPKGVVGR